MSETIVKDAPDLSRGAMPRPGKTVCVIDRDPAVCDGLKVLLRTLGFVVHTFADAESFVERGGHHDARCLIVDLDLPGMSGIELARWLAERRIRVPVILLTNEPDLPAVADAVKAGDIELVEKPGIDQALVTRLRRLLSAPAIA